MLTYRSNNLSKDPLADAQAGLVRLQHCSRHEAFADDVCLHLERGARGIEDVDERALAESL